MKKLFFASVFALGTLTAVNAQTEEKQPTAMNETSVETVAAKRDASLTAQDYKELKASELPKSVKDAVAKAYQDATISKAYKNGKGEFKLVITTLAADGVKKASKTVYLDSNGKWIKGNK